MEMVCVLRRPVQSGTLLGEKVTPRLMPTGSLQVMPGRRGDARQERARLGSGSPDARRNYFTPKSAKAQPLRVGPFHLCLSRWEKDTIMAWELVLCGGTSGL